MKQHHKDQLYAYNSAKELVRIDDAKRQEKYYCVYCDGEMIPKQGKKNKWHYAHKNVTPHCSYDHYLHTLAEIKLSEWFRDNKNIQIELKTNFECKNWEKCKWSNKDDYYDEEYCHWEEHTPFNLKDYYTDCVVEKKYGNFVPDICLYNNHKDIDPIFIEINVHHPCEEDKISSKFRIIEIDIEKEEDIENIINSSTIPESESIRFYNFKRTLNRERLPHKLKPLSKTTLFDSYKFYNSSCDCINYNKHHKRALVEIVTPLLFYYHPFQDVSHLDYGLLRLTEIAPKFRTCNLCKYHKIRDYTFDWDNILEPESTQDKSNSIFCCLYKTLKKEKYCKSTDAMTCSAYKLFGSDRIKAIRKYYNTNEVYIWEKDKA